MKIEMGESLFYSWLRHVKACQVVQTNWKVSRQWELHNEKKLSLLMAAVDKHFSERYKYSVFKGNTSLNQLLQQGECDVLGIHTEDGKNQTFAIDVAFHENGLNYGDRATTVMKVIEKCARTAFCLYGYLGATDSEIIFASPKINRAVLNDLEPCISDLNDIFNENDFDFSFCLLENEGFNNQVLQPILSASRGTSDTAELFLRSYQMLTMFSPKKESSCRKTMSKRAMISDSIESESIVSDSYCEFKVGQLAKQILRKMLRDGSATKKEVAAMQTPEYSKEQFGIQYPLLAKVGTDFDRVRYYVKPFTVYDEQYYMCSQWFEDDRQYLLTWIDLHSK